MVEFFVLVLGLLYLYIVVKLWRICLYGINVLRFYRHSTSDSVENYSNVNLDGETRKVRGKLSEFSEGKESLVTGEKSPFIGWYIQRKGERIDGNLVWKTIGNGIHQEPFIIDTGEETFEVDFPKPELPTGKPVANRFLESDWSLLVMMWLVPVVSGTDRADIWVSDVIRSNHLPFGFTVCTSV